jgi:hypothetical protein
MKPRMIRIGNSKSLVNQSVVGPAHSPREDWNEGFRLMSERRDDVLIDEPLPTSFDETEWEW